jgi:hypothetical protein
VFQLEVEASFYCQLIETLGCFHLPVVVSLVDESLEDYMKSTKIINEVAALVIAA